MPHLSCHWNQAWISLVFQLWIFATFTHSLKNICLWNFSIANLRAFSTSGFLPHPNLFESCCCHQIHSKYLFQKEHYHSGSLINNTHVIKNIRVMHLKDRVRIKVKLSSWSLKKLLTTILTKKTPVISCWSHLVTPSRLNYHRNLDTIVLDITNTEPGLSEQTGFGI